MLGVRSVLFEMEKVINLLFENSSQSFHLTNGRLLFEFSEFEIICDIDLKKSDLDLEYGAITLENLNKLSNLEFNDFYLASSEYLGWRVDIGEYTEPQSICNKMYSFLQVLHKIGTRSIFKYELSQNEGYVNVDGYLCNIEPNYIFEIHIYREFYSNFEFIKLLLSSLSELNESFTPPRFYWPYYKRYQRVEDSRQISIVNTNTKVRRIGYFKLLNNFFLDQERVSENLVNKKFEEYVEPYNDQLSKHKNNKGLIDITKRGSSSKPYIESAKELKFVTQLNRVLAQGKLFKVYGVLRKETPSNNENMFSLDKLDKIFFLETILKEDFIYISLLLELIIKQTGKTSYNSLKEDFHPALLAKLNLFLNTARINQDNKSQRKIQVILNRVKNWKKPEVYLEHILMPRLNWLYDLDLIDISDNLIIKINSFGKRLHQNICYWNDINWSQIISPNEFLNHFAIHAFDVVYTEGTPQPDYNRDQIENINNKIDNYINFSFSYFKTLAPNRVTASQAITYTKYKLYFNDELTVGHRYIVNYLSEKNQTKFIYKYQSQYGDGYIQKVRK